MISIKGKGNRTSTDEDSITPRHEAKLPEFNYIISFVENLSNSNKKVIKYTLVVSSWHYEWLTRQLDRPKLSILREWNLERGWALNTHYRKPQLQERPAQNRGVLMQISNHCCSQGVRIGWKPLWWLISLHSCQELSLALLRQPVTARQREISLQALPQGHSRPEEVAGLDPSIGWHDGLCLVGWRFWGHNLTRLS